MKEQNLLLIRADANKYMGTGHVMRCLAFAQVWQDVGGQVLFAFIDSVSLLNDRLQQEGMQITQLTAVLPGSEEDALETVALAQNKLAQWIVVDGYQFNATYQKELANHHCKTLFLDDYGHADHYYANFILNQNIYARPDFYKNREPDVQLLLGTKYTLLRREFLEWRAWTREIAPGAKKLLVTLGGSDPDNITLIVIEALKKLEINVLEIVIVVGSSNPHAAVLEAAIAESNNNNFQIQQNVTNMPELMAWADVSITAGGTTTWELSFMGVPNLILVLADNQQLVAEGVNEYGAAIYLDYSEISEEKILSSMQKLLPFSVRTDMSLRGKQLVDGRGGERILQRLNVTELKLRPASVDDCKLLWEWTNDPVVRATSFSLEPIPWEQHVAWFHNKLESTRSIIYIAINGHNTPVGQVRFDLDDQDEAIISVSLAADFRNYGYGRVLINSACKKIFNETNVNIIHAYIKQTNKASKRAFEKAGFITKETVKMKEHQSWHLTVQQSLL